MYDQSLGAKQDHTKALKWYRRAAEQGYAEALSNLANMYRTGHGVLQDLDEALIWHCRAAEQGDTLAQNHLGTMLALGTGVAKDLVQTCRWFAISAAAGNETGAKKRDSLMQRLSPEQIAESERLAQGWQEAH